MATSHFAHAADVRLALRAIASDREHGVPALSAPQVLSNLLTDLLPDAPRETGLLVAAARAGVPDLLREHVTQGMDVATAAGLAAAAMANSTAFAADACEWVTAELAFALGFGDVRRGSARQSSSADEMITSAGAADPADGEPTTVASPHAERRGTADHMAWARTSKAAAASGSATLPAASADRNQRGGRRRLSLPQNILVAALSVLSIFLFALGLIILPGVLAAIYLDRPLTRRTASKIMTGYGIFAFAGTIAFIAIQLGVSSESHGIITAQVIIGASGALVGLAYLIAGSRLRRKITQP